MRRGVTSPNTLVSSEVHNMMIISLIVILVIAIGLGLSKEFNL